jgi:hypothetical protein
MPEELQQELRRFFQPLNTMLDGILNSTCGGKIDDGDCSKDCDNTLNSTIHKTFGTADWYP